MEKLNNIKWKLQRKKKNLLLKWGLINGLITPYDDELIQNLRKIYYGSIPASIILLSNSLCNGFCYDRALLLSRVFLDSDDDVNLIYADVDSIKLNPLYKNEKNYDHCIVERITKDNLHLIYDTSTGLVYDKYIYWLLERPKVRKINNKQSIKDFVELENYSDINDDKYGAILILPMIDKICGRHDELYSTEEYNLLEKEIKHYKEFIKYDELKRRIQRQYYVCR